MSFSPVVAPNEPVVIAKCPRCSGSALFHIEKYMTDPDREDLERLLAAGYLSQRIELAKAGAAHDCECRPEDLATALAPQSIKVAPRPTGKPVLSLKKK